MVQLPSPPVVHGEIGKTPPSKVSFLDPDIHVSRLGCCDGADVEVNTFIGLLLGSIAEGIVVVGPIAFVAVGSVVATGFCDGADVEVNAIVGVLLDTIAEGLVVVGLIVFVAVGSVVATGKAIVGLLPDGIAEGGEVFVLIVCVAVGPVVAKGEVIVGILLCSIAEGREAFGLPVLVAVGSMLVNSVGGGEGIGTTGGNTEFIPCSLLVDFPLFVLSDFAPLPKSFGFFDDTATSLK